MKTGKYIHHEQEEAIWAVCVDDKTADMLAGLFINCLLICHLQPEEGDNNVARERSKRVLGVTLFIEINSLKSKCVWRMHSEQWL